VADLAPTSRRRPARNAPRGVVPLGARRSRAPLALALLVLGGAGCGEPPGSTPLDPAAAAVVRSLERLAFVPAGRTALDIDVGVDVDLLVDRFEVTEALWAELFGEEDPRPGSFASFAARQVGAAPPESWILEAPAVGMTLAEAGEAAARRGMRLPTFEEWLWCAAGPRSRRFPAGRQQRGLANTLELGLFRPTPVGAFESGQTPDTGLFDLLGNVWEWTEPPPPPAGWRSLDADAWPVDGGAGAPAWVLGGSFSTPEQVLFTRDGVALAMGVTPGHRGSDVGVRCVAEARAFIAGLASAAGPLPAAARPRVVAVGDRWGGRSVEALLRASEGVPQGLENPWVEALLEGAGRGGPERGGIAAPAGGAAAPAGGSGRAPR